MRGDFTSRLRPALAGTSRRMKVIGAAVIIMILLTGISLVYFIRPIMTITNEPVYAADMTSDQHVVIYSVDVNGNNITVGEISITWQIIFVDNTSEYDWYELSLVEHVRGSAADLGEVGWIEGGHTLVDLRSDNLSVEDWSETHGEGAVQLTTSAQSDWNGSIEWEFVVLFVSPAFNPREASNRIEFTVSIKAVHGSDVNLTIYAFSDWSIYGYSFDRILIHGLETIVINLGSLS
jgi:hypothetical protein